MRRFKAEAHLSRIPAIHRFGGNDNKAGHIVLIIINGRRQHLQAVKAARNLAGYGGLVSLSIGSDLAGRHRRVLHADLTPLLVAVQIFAALHQRLGMRIHGLNIIQPRLWKPQKSMSHPQLGFRHNIVGMLHQQIIVVAHCPGGGILNGKYRVVGSSLLHLHHGVLPAGNVIHRRIRSEKLDGRPVAVSALHPLINHPDSFLFQGIHRAKAQLQSLPVFRQILVLALAANGHQLREKLPHRLAVKVPFRHFLQSRQLLLLPLAVVNRLSRSQLGFCHVHAQGHTLLKQPDHPGVDLIQLLPDLK